MLLNVFSKEKFKTWISVSDKDLGRRKLVEINPFSKEGSGSSEPSQIRSRRKKGRLTKSHHHRLKLGSDAGIESIGMCPQLVKEF